MNRGTEIDFVCVLSECNTQCLAKRQNCLVAFGNSYSNCSSNCKTVTTRFYCISMQSWPTKWKLNKPFVNVYFEQQVIIEIDLLYFDTSFFTGIRRRNSSGLTKAIFECFVNFRMLPVQTSLFHLWQAVHPCTMNCKWVPGQRFASLWFVLAPSANELTPI
jgi:hypothetical protein